MKLFCVPYAGSGASTYGPWRRRFSHVATVSPVQLPGREEQFDLPFCSRVDEAAKLVADDIASKHDGPYAIFGHSMGALIAFEATHRLLALEREAPSALIVSAFPAPSVYRPRLTVAQLERDGFKELKALLGETFAGMLGDSQLFEYAARTMRADISMCERYRYVDRPPLAMPVRAFGAYDDPLCLPSELEAWAAHCGAGLSVRMFDGDHFYFKGNKAFESELERALLASS